MRLRSRAKTEVKNVHGEELWVAVGGALGSELSSIH